MARTSKKKLNAWEPFDYIVFIILTLFALLIFYPFYNAVLSSFVSAKTYALNPAMVIPTEFIVSNYKHILTNSNLLNGYANTLIMVFLGVPYSLLLTTLCAYVLSRKPFPGKKLFFFIALFTMFFNGGIVPTYINMRNLGLTGTVASVIFHYSISTYYMIIIKNSFEAVPEALEEAAKIDGANDLTIFIRIMLPLILPTLATFGLFITVDRWNEWYYAMIYIRDATKQPVQLILRNIVSQTNMNLVTGASIEPDVYSDGIKMASVVVTMLPVMIVYPFLQKYFVKGVMVGAVKM